MRPPDLYRHFRAPAYNSVLGSTRASVMGQFDPLSAVASYHPEVQAALRAPASPGQPELVSRGDPLIESYATVLHETIHWWQHAGTTAGAVYGLSVASSVASAGGALSEIGQSVPKPIVSVTLDSPDLADDHPAVELASSWLVLEHGAMLLLTPTVADAKIRALPACFRSTGAAVLLVHAATVDAVQQGVGASALPGFASVDGLAATHERLSGPGTGPFGEGVLVRLPLGMRELLEGQARVSELQYRHLTHHPLPWAEARASGALKGVYGAAFDLFLKLARLPVPTFPSDDQVWLFLLIVDIALNPDEGYAFEVDEQSDFFLRVHPGLRFMELCRAVEKDSRSILRRLRPLTRAVYDSLSNELCGRLGWRPPREVHERVTNSLSAVPELGPIIRNFEQGNWGATNLPIRFFLWQHKRLLEAKLKHPEFFCWPANALAIRMDVAERTARERANRLATYGPPFSMSLPRSLDQIAIALPNLTDAQALRLAQTYFGSIALTDLMRQWLAKRGDFQFNFAWEPALHELQVADLKTIFHQSLGFEIDAIPHDQ